MIKVIIFDYGGVIGKETTDYIFKAVSAAYRLKPEQIRKEFYKFIFSLQTGKIKEKFFWQELAKSLGITDASGLKNFWLAEHQKYAKLNDKVLTIVKKLKSCYKLCLLANTISFYQKKSIEEKLKQVFPVIVYSYKVGLRKPDRKIYNYVLKKLKVEPEECVIIDDSEKNLVYPKKLGMITVHFKSFRDFRK